MTGRRTVIGVDPGPTSGVCLLGPGLAHELVQCSAGILLTVVRALIDAAPGDASVLIAVERFVVGPRAARSATAHAGQVTRDLIGGLATFEQIPTWSGQPIAVLQRAAVEVKPWADDGRLRAAGLYLHGMPHARDGARHALYAAVHDCGVPDPLSRRARRAGHGSART